MGVLKYWEAMIVLLIFMIVSIFAISELGFFVKREIIPIGDQVKDGQIWVKDYPSYSENSLDSIEECIKPDTIEIIDVRNGVALYLINGQIESDSTYIIPINSHLIVEAE